MVGNLTDSNFVITVSFNKCVPKDLKIRRLEFKNGNNCLEWLFFEVVLFDNEDFSTDIGKLLLNISLVVTLIICDEIFELLVVKTGAVEIIVPDCVTNVLLNNFLREALVEKTKDALSVCDDLLRVDSNEMFVKLVSKTDIIDT